MQLKKNSRISGAVALAAGSLVGGTAVAGDGDWKIDSALMLYSEQDRVSAVEPVVNAQRELGADEYLNVRAVVDSLTGSSHNGAPVRPYTQTFTSPSGNAEYDVLPGEVPLDDSFHDTRGNVAVSWDRPWANPLYRSTIGANVSSEYDFFSLGVNGTVSRDLNKRNTTLTGGLAFESDTISPVGGVPTPLSAMDSGETQGSDESRTVTDLLLGITQVLGRNTIAQVNYNLGMSSGYHNDPYKIVADDSFTGTADPGDFYYESRPDSRTKHSLYGSIKHALGNTDIIDGSYRFMTDDWGVVSHTVDLRYRHFMRNEWFIEPHLRWYSQSEADFWVESLPVAPVVGSGENASGDYRLGALTDTTVGLKFGKKFKNDQEVSMRVESFQQSGDTEPADLSAMILEFGYSFRW